MNIPNKQIGWSVEANLIWLIAKKINKISKGLAIITTTTTTTTAP